MLEPPMKFGCAKVFTVGLVLGMLLAVGPAHALSPLPCIPALLCCGVGLFCGSLCGYLVAAARQPVVVPVGPPPIASMDADVYYMSPAGSRLHVDANCFQLKGAAQLTKLVCRDCAKKKD